MTAILIPGTNREARIASVERFLRQAMPGKKLLVEVKAYRPERSPAQNNSLFGVAYPPLMEFMGLAGDEEKQELHRDFCGEFFGWVASPLGNGRKPKRTTTRDEYGNRDVLDTSRMQEFYEFVQRKGSEIGCYVPSPNEYEAPA